MGRAWLTSVLALGSLLGSGCSLLDPYPPVVAETGALCGNRIDDDFDGLFDCDDVVGCAASPACAEVGEGACTDGRDNDRDGHTDCDDPGCGGLCPEVEASACFDGIDQDHDGLTDREDPGCWPFRPPTVHRCASTRGTSASWAFSPTRTWPGDGSAWFANDDLYVWDETPTPGLFAWAEPEAYLGARDVLGIASMHTRVSAVVRTYGIDDDEYPTSSLTLMLVPEPLAPAGGRPLPAAEAARIALVLDFDRGVARLVSPSGSSEAAFSTTGQYELAIEIDAGVLSAHVRQGMRELVSLPSLPWIVDATQWRPMVGVFGEASVLAAGLETAGTDPCEHRVPELPAAQSFGDTSGVRDLGLTVAADVEPEGYCVLVLGCEERGLDSVATLSAWASADGVVWQRRPPPAEPRSGTTLLGAGIAWDADALRHRVAVARAGSDGLASVEIVSGEYCGLWGAAEESGLTGLALDGVDACRTEGGHGASISLVLGAGGHSQLWLHGGLGAGRRPATVVADASDGVHFTSAAPFEDGLGGPITVQRIGTADLVRIRPAIAPVVPALVVEVRDSASGAWRALPATYLEGTRAPGTFDADAPLAGALVASGSGDLTFVYSAFGEFVDRRRSGLGYAATGTARVELAPE